MPVLAGAAGALGASYCSPYIALDGSYYARPSGQMSSSASSRYFFFPINFQSVQEYFFHFSSLVIFSVTSDSFCFGLHMLKFILYIEVDETYICILRNFFLGGNMINRVQDYMVIQVLNRRGTSSNLGLL